MKLFIPVILGTGREGRRSEKVARFVFDEAGKHPDIETELLDVGDFRLPATDRTEGSEILDGSYKKQLGVLLEELVWFAKALKSAREEVEKT